MPNDASHALPFQPVLFDPALEQLARDEAKTISELVEVLQYIGRAAVDESGHAYRSVHAKGQGIIHGEMQVLDGLPPELAQGVFAMPAIYPVILRFSTNPGDILDDSVSTPRGLAMKIIGVTGDRLPGSEKQQTQDFVMQDGPALSAGTPEAYLGKLKLFARTTATPQVLKKALSTILRGAEYLLEAMHHPSSVLKSFGGHPATNLLGETYYTMAPVLYGPYIAKLCLVPRAPGLTMLHGAPIRVRG